QIYPPPRPDDPASRIAVGAGGRSAPESAAPLAQLKQVSIRILEPRGVTPGELEHLRRLERHAARLQCFERRPAIFHLDCINRGPQHSLARRAGPQNELKVLSLDADGQESRSGRR